MKQKISENVISKKIKMDKLIDIVFFVVLLALVSGIMLTLFIRQTRFIPGQYPSDMYAYILEMQGLDSGYSFPYPILFKLGAFINLFCTPELSMALATMLLNSLAIVMIKLFFNHYLLDTCKEHLGVKSWLAGIFISIASVSLFFVSMLFPVGNIFYLPGIKNNYLGVFTSNPFHNATYMAARPFAVPSFFLFAKLLDIYEEGYKREYLKDYLLFAFFLLASTMAKPSFTIVLVAAAGLIMLYRLIKSRFKNIIATIQLGLCFIPTFIDLLYQFKGVFVPDEGVEGGIGFCLGEVWKYYCDNIPLAICLAVGFPLVVLVFNYKEITKNTMYRFSWQMYIAGFVMAFFCYEKGFRMADFNFSWSYMYGIFFCFVASLLVLCRKTALSCEKRIFVLIQWLAYAAHLVCGLYYFMTIFRGGMYY